MPAVAGNTGSIARHAADAQLQAAMEAEMNILDRDKEAIYEMLHNLEIQIGKEIRKGNRIIARDMKEG